MSRPLRRRQSVSPQPPPKEERKEKPSSEIDLDDVLRMAREADERAKSEEPEPKKKGTRRPPKDGPEPPPQPEVIEPDPEFVSMCQWGVGAGVDFMSLRLDWSDPGIHWKEKVSFLCARIIQRIQPMEPSLTTDLITVGGYTLLWALPNVTAQRAIKRTRKDTHTLGNDGERKNPSDAPSTATGG